MTSATFTSVPKALPAIVGRLATTHAGRRTPSKSHSIRSSETLQVVAAGSAETERGLTLRDGILVWDQATFSLDAQLGEVAEATPEPVCSICFYTATFSVGLPARRQAEAASGVHPAGGRPVGLLRSRLQPQQIVSSRSAQLSCNDSRAYTTLHLPVA